MRNSCIRKRFVGNYRVNDDPGLHFPVRIVVNAQVAAPSW